MAAVREGDVDVHRYCRLLVGMSKTPKEELDCIINYDIKYRMGIGTAGSAEGSGGAEGGDDE